MGRRSVLEKVKKNYRIRGDINRELESAVILMNRYKVVGVDRITETQIVESAIVRYCQELKDNIMAIEAKLKKNEGTDEFKIVT